MQIIENWSEVSGELLDHYPSQTNKGFVTLEVKINDVRDVEGFKNLLDDKRGEAVHVHVPESLWQGTEPKQRAKVSMRVRMGPSRKLFVHPEHFKVK